MNYSQSSELIKAGFNKTQLKEMESIVPFETLQLANMGSDDSEGYQVFTPHFIVEQMSDAIGPDLLDFSKNVLEPTSGDGAFTTYILFKRLETVKDDYAINAFRALSTIYSVEMDKKLIEKQRNNILTVIRDFLSLKGVDLTDDLLELFRCVIYKNFIWAMFNSEDEITWITPDVIYKMPEAEKKNYKSMSFPVWDITDETITFHEEGAEIA